MTFAELNARANQLAHHLRALGVAPEVLVGVCFERSPELIIALLGILKAGGAYVPLDPNYPAERLAFMLEDAHFSILLTQERWLARLPTLNAQTICLDRDAPLIARAPTSDPPRWTTPDQLAYVIYTSGSTGRPKGVLGLHRGFLNRFAWMWRHYPFAPDEVGCQKTSLNFLDSVWEIFGPLLQGRPVVLVPDELVPDPQHLVPLLARWGVSRIVLVPSLLRIILAAFDDLQRALPRLRYWVSSGEELPVELTRSFRARLPQAMLLNLYGASEVSADSLWHDTSTRDDLAVVPIGRPIANTQVYLLDARHQLLPAGSIGELYIGGVGLARGYLGQPALTAERFIPNPFARGMGDGGWGMEDASPSPIPHPPSPGTRLYRTGDLARYLPDGTITYVGRADQQVKVRGFRIELGEVATALRRHPAVREAVVRVLNEGAGNARLVAYVVPKIEDRGLKIEDSGSEARDPLSSILYPLSSELRGFLQTRLPDYMLPSAFVLLDALPLTPSGKIDYRQLPVPESTRPDLDTTFVAPRTPIEEVLASLWAEVLGLERIGVEDNFFALGGHSLLATQVVARVRATLAVELPLRALFEAPTVARLAAHLQLLRHDPALPLPPPLRPAPPSDTFPLSFAQQRLWFLDQLLPTSSAYTIPAALRLSGPLDLAGLQRGLTALLARQAALRSHFPSRAGQPFQQIAALRPMALPLLDLRALPSAAREVSALLLAADEAARPFDLSHGPLLRLKLTRLAADEHLLLLTMHHIISDAWSLGVLVRELVALYQAEREQRAVRLPALPIQYTDYALWQREWLQGAVLEAQLAYWREQLAGLVPLELPTDAPRMGQLDWHGAVAHARLGPALLRELYALSQRASVTLFMTLLAAWQLLFSRYSGQHDLALGAPIAGRIHKETEDLIGFFVNTLVLRVRLAGGARVREVLGQVREVMLGAYAHQELPFERLVEELHPARDLSRHPLFQVMVAVQNAPVAELAVPGLEVRPVEVAGAGAKFELTITISEAGGGLEVSVSYARELFGEATIERMLGHYQVLLAGMVADVEQPIAALPLLSAQERRQLLLDWNATQTPYPADISIHRLIESQAAQRRDAVALVFDRSQRSGVRGQGTDTPLPPPARGGTEGGRSQGSGVRSQESEFLAPNTQHPTPNTRHLTYRELNARANQLAHHLRRLGVGPDICVALAVERSPELIIGLLGILKAGGAYLPLDPSYPRERLAFMLQDAQALVLITTNDQRPTTNDQPLDAARGRRPTTSTPSPLHPFTLSPCHLVTLSESWPAIAAESPSNPVCRATPDNLAYVTYTSGSTGLPKGVAIPHRGVVRLVQATDYVSLSTDETFVQLAPLAFDASTFEVWGSLLNGARLLLLPPGLPSLAELGAALLRQQVSTLWLTASLFLQMVETQLTSLRGVRQLLAGGDVLSMLHVRRVLNELPGCHLINGYGPTENTTFTCCTTLRADSLLGASVPIGRPIANTTVYLLDAQMQPVPIGVAGELYAGGAGLARGYLHRPDLTAERFVPNPFAGVTGDGCWVTEDAAPNTQHPTPNTRLYRTGDLARYRPDGQIEFLGRIDQQVKVRGFRIEPAEIEMLLAEHQAIREVVVVAREDRPGEKRLVAYVVPKIEDSNLGSSERLSSIFYPLSSELRDFLKERLPDYMVPSAFVLLDALPRTPSGKIDRRMLPAPEPTHFALDKQYVAPRMGIETVIAGVWAQVLGLERVGRHDQFFDLGGHSLLATQVVARLSDAFGVSIPLRTLFEAPTVASMAAALLALPLQEAGSDSDQICLIPLAPRDRPLPLSSAQQRLWFLNQLQPDSALATIAICLRLVGRLDLTALETSLRTIIARHEVLRTTFAVVDGQLTQIVGRVGPLQLTLVDLRTLLPAIREPAAFRLTVDEAARPFDLARGPLLRVTLLRLGPDEHGLLLTMHHIISDAWSLGVFVAEMAALYRGQGAALPELPIQYADYAAAQQEWLRGAAMQAQLAYWQQQLRGPLPTLELPTDRPRPPMRSFAGAQRTFRLPSPLSTGLRAPGQDEGATLFMLLLAGFAVVLARYSGQEDLLLGAPIAGRTCPQVEGLIGCFVNTLVLRADLSGAPTFQAFLQRVREVCLEAYAHQDLPFEHLVEVLQPVRDLSRHPLFQVMVGLQNAPLAPLELPGLALMPLTIEYKIANFDLSLWFSEDDAELVAGLDYSTDLFDAATIERMLGHFQTLLAGATDNPSLRLADLPLLSDAEQRQLLVEWNATDRGVRGQGSGVRSELSGAELLTSGSRCIHELFEAQAVRTPDAVALVFDGPQPGVWGLGSGVWGQRDKQTRSQESGVRSQESEFLVSNPQSPILSPQSSVLSPQSSVLSPEHLSYRELNERANQVAHHLRGLGVGPEVLVGVCMERSAELVIALLGVLTAGGAYLPLDPRYPAERLAFMLEDSQACVLITTTDAEPRTKNQEPGTASFQELGLDNDLITQNSKLKTQNSPRPFTRSLLHPFTPSGSVVDLHIDWPVIARHPTHAPDSDVRPEHMAYVIYTSGSTGRPKGVVNTHAGISNRLRWMQDAYHLSARDCVLQKTSISFDVSVWEFFWPLLAGARLALARPEEHKNPAYLAHVIARQQVTTLHFVPSMLRPFLHEPQVERCTTVQRVICSGEVLPVDLQERFFAQFDAELHNLYGPTEAAVDVTAWACRRGASGPNVPIGRPIANTQVYVLDTKLRPVPIGVAGELSIGGVQLARGYLNRAALTAERFIPNPFGDKETPYGGVARRQGLPRVGTRGDKETGDDEVSTQNLKLKTQNLRLYRTGDLARYQSDGAIMFLGRADQQVKLRGFRIELGEIEAVLRQHPGVREAVVVMREEPPDRKQLVAYIVQGSGVRGQGPTPLPPPAGGGTEGGAETRRQGDREIEGLTQSSVLSPQSSVLSELRGYLQERLPDYMVPSAFVLLDALPLTPNGKLDRAALPVPDGTRPVLATTFVAPRTPIEAELAAIWRELLGVERIGIYDNFFELGGHSLLLTRLAARIRAAFQIELPLRILFDMPTVVDMTVAIGARQVELEDADEVAQMLEELEQLSPEDLAALLTEEEERI